MERRTFENLVAERGWCCPYGCLAVEDLKAQRTPAGRLKASWFKAAFDLEKPTCYRILREWRDGEIKCAGREKCVLVLSGIKKEQIPTISESRAKFLGLRGSRYNALRGRLVFDDGAYILQLLGKPIPCSIISTSPAEWLWVEVAMEHLDEDLKLGDTLYLSEEYHGTVIDLSGPNAVILLPGNFHQRRDRKP